MIKRKAAYALVGGLLITGLAFNAPAMATYVQNFKATQTINAATWNIEFDNKLGEHTIYPGGTVSNDTITLTNNNNYPVKYTIELINKGDKAFNDALSLTVTDGTNSYTDKSGEGEGEVILEAGDILILNSNVTWNATGNDTIHAGKKVEYNYNIKAEKAGEETPEEVVLFTDLKVKPSSNMRTEFTLTENIDISRSSEGNVKFEYLDSEGNTIYDKDKMYYDGYLLDSNNNNYGQGMFGSHSGYGKDLVAGETYRTSITDNKLTDKDELAKENAVKVRVTVTNNSGKRYSDVVDVIR